MESKERELFLSVPSVRDIEAPLGGTSTVYEIVLVEGDEQFTYTKTFREIEDFSRKLQKKFTTENFPVLPTGTDVEEKRQAAQTLLKFISKKPKIFTSSITQQFIGQDRSIKHIVKDKNQNPTLPPVTTSSDLFDDLFKESAFLSNTKDRNLFDDDSCELFSSKAEETSPKQEEPPTQSIPKDTPNDLGEQGDQESDSDEVDRLFIPRKESLIQPDDLYEDNDELFRVDDNLNDLLLNVTRKAETASTQTLDTGAKTETQVTVPPNTQSSQVPRAQPASERPSKPPKPTLKPKPVVKPKPAHLQRKNSSETTVHQSQPPLSSDLNPVDINSYIEAAEKDTLREVNLFD